MHEASVNYDALFLVSLGGMILAGLATSVLGHRTALPRVTLLLVFGMCVGPQGLDYLPAVFTQHFDLVSQMTLLMVGFLIGGKLTTQTLDGAMLQSMYISICGAVLTAVLVCLGLVLFSVSSLELAVLLGCIAAATAPAAVIDVIMEHNFSGRFKDLLLSVVALDDGWAMILFGLGIAIVFFLMGESQGQSTLFSVWIAFRDIVGALVLGGAIGVPAIFLTGRLRPGQPMLSEALGIVFLCGGLALWFEVSFLVASMVMGALIGNFARHHEYAFHEIEGIENQFMVIFFIVAGASLEFDALGQLGSLGIAYILLRTAGKIIGVGAGAQLSNASPDVKKWMGLAMMPQAGVPIGMALVAAGYFPEYGQQLLTVVIGSTVFFELFGPLATRYALEKTCEKKSEVEQV